MLDISIVIALISYFYYQNIVYLRCIFSTRRKMLTGYNKYNPTVTKKNPERTLYIEMVLYSYIDKHTN
jgi:hypothetical protein